MDEGDAGGGGGAAEAGVEAEAAAVDLCPIMYPHEPPPELKMACNSVLAAIWGFLRINVSL